MDNKETSIWSRSLRIAAKAALLILLLNVIFALISPQEAIGRLSLYNSVSPGRLRLPYGENAQQSYNVSLFNIPAMLASHVVSMPKERDEYRVFIIGDSGAWGWLLANEDSLASQINQARLVTSEGQQVVAYNLGYPIMSLTKDLMFLEASMPHRPDLIIWPVTLESFPREKQLFAPIVQNNPGRIRQLIESYDLQVDAQDSNFIDPSFVERTIIGQRRNLADLFRHQFYALSWAATGIDQAIPEEIKLRRSDFEEDLSWQDFHEPVELTGDDLALEMLDAGSAIAGDVPLLIINEPMYISSGLNSHLRYNSFYPRWAYDQYRVLLRDHSNQRRWAYVDLWNAVDPQEFTDTPVHLTPQGTQVFADELVEVLKEIVNQGNDQRAGQSP